MQNLDFTGLPPLPQCERLRVLATDLWADNDVVALWHGGSLARNRGGVQSDVDMRVAVCDEAFANGALPASAHILTSVAVISLSFPWNNGPVLYHLLLRDGDIYDVLVQSVKHTPSEETRLVLGCRDTTFAAQLAGGEDPAPTQFPVAQPNDMHTLILSLWLGQRKHLKVLHRGLPLVAWQGEHRLRQDLMRVWFVLATGTDCGPISRLTIHTISPVVRAIEAEYGSYALTQLGGPLSTKQENIAGAAQTQNEIVRAGRLLADRLSFSYPVEAEETVRRLWLSVAE
jgi:hypothetical protein